MVVNHCVKEIIKKNILKKIANIAMKIIVCYPL